MYGLFFSYIYSYETNDEIKIINYFHANEISCRKIGPLVAHSISQLNYKFDKFSKNFSQDPHPENFSPSGSMQKQYSQYLMVPELSKSHASSDTSLTSRAQTPILQQLYMTMTHWERVVANSAEKNLRKLRKAKHLGKRDSFEGMSSMGDLSDVSSVDFPSMLEMHQSLKLKARRQNQFMKSASLGPMTHETSSSVDSVDENAELEARSGASRALSAPPFVLNVKGLITTMFYFLYSLH